MTADTEVSAAEGVGLSELERDMRGYFALHGAPLPETVLNWADRLSAASPTDAGGGWVNVGALYADRNAPEPLRSLAYYVGNPSAWDDYSERLSETIRRALDYVAPRTAAEPDKSAAGAGLTAACEPWKHHTGDPPDYDSPLAAVFGAGMAYTEALLARHLGVKSYEGGDGSEDFDQDATQTLENILIAAGLYDPEGGAWAKLPGADVSHTWPLSEEATHDAGPYAARAQAAPAPVGGGERDPAEIERLEADPWVKARIARAERESYQAGFAARAPTPDAPAEQAYSGTQPSENAYRSVETVTPAEHGAERGEGALKELRAFRSRLVSKVQYLNEQALDLTRFQEGLLAGGEEVLAFLTEEALAQPPGDAALDLGPKEISYQIEQGEDGVVAEAHGPEDAARREALHYAAVYGQDGLISVFRVSRREWRNALAPAQSQTHAGEPEVEG